MALPLDWDGVSFSCQVPVGCGPSHCGRQLWTGTWRFAGLWKRWLWHRSPRVSSRPGSASSPGWTQTTRGLTRVQEAGRLRSVFVISGQVPWWDSAGQVICCTHRLVPKAASVSCWAPGWQFRRGEPVPMVVLGSAHRRWLLGRYVCGVWGCSCSPWGRTCCCLAFCGCPAGLLEDLLFSSGSSKLRSVPNELFIKTLDTD